MPSKNGFGNSRTPLTKKVQYGANQKNPIKRAGADAMTAVAKGESIVASEARSNPIKRAGADAMTAVAKGESVMAAEASKTNRG
tara:strand:- start:1359 stop:1610 length:252 start_codon:yes stop_codon:yes gene_type:complete